MRQFHRGYVAEFGLYPLICDCTGKGGYHVREFFKKPIASRVVHWLARRSRIA